MAYCTEADITARIGTALLAQLSNDTANSGAVDSTVVTAMIVQSDSIIDAYANQIYTTPLSTLDTIVTIISVNLTIYYLFSRRPAQLATSDQWKDIYKDMMVKLQGISDQSVDLPNSVLKSSEISLTSNDKMFDFYNTQSETSLY